MHEEIAVLHVDDEPAFIDLVETFLERHVTSVSITSVVTVDAALEALESDGFDCIVSDYDMPSMNGLELLEAVRQDDPDLPFILFTGKGSEEIASEAISAGVTDYVQKGGADQYAVLANRIENATMQYRNSRELEIKTRAIDDAPIGVAMSEVTDGDLVLTDANRALCAISGKQRAELVGDSPWFLDDEGGEGVGQRVTQAVEARESLTIEHRRCDPADHPVWHRTTLAPVTATGGEADRYISFHEDITQRKDRERRLERHRDLLERTQRIAAVGGWELDLETDELQWTEEVHRIFEVGSEYEPTLEAAVERYHPEDRPRVRAAVKRAIETGESFDEEWRVQTATGADKWVRSRGERETRDGIDCLRGTVQDISERVGRQSHTRAQATAIEASTDGVALLDSDRRVRYANESFVHRFGYDELEAIDGVSWHELFEGGAQLAKTVFDTVRESGNWSGETRGVRADGRTVDLEVSVTGVENGTTACVVRDISDQKHRAETVESLHRVATALQSEGSVEAVCERTVEAAAELLDFDACTIVIQEGEWLVPYATSEGTPPNGSRRMRIDQGLAGDTFQRGEPSIIGNVDQDDRSDPADETYQSGISVPLGDHGVFQATETGPNGFDQTDLELAELLLTHAATAIDRLEYEQTLEAQNERLQEFSSVVSHDIRNPLNVASGHLDLAATSPTDAGDYLEVASEALERIETLIDDLLVLARDGKDIDEVEAVDLEELVTECWANVETGDAAVEFMGPPGATVLVDRTRAAQLFENLFRNAIEHGTNGGAVADADLTVGVEPIHGGFAVEDDGRGIPPEHRDRVFSSGFTTADSGTGVGLSIVEQVAQAHGWDVRLAESDAGGVRFEFTGVESVTESAGESSQ